MKLKVTNITKDKTISVAGNVLKPGDSTVLDEKEYYTRSFLKKWRTARLISVETSGKRAGKVSGVVRKKKAQAPPKEGPVSTPKVESEPVKTEKVEEPKVEPTPVVEPEVKTEPVEKTKEFYTMLETAEDLGIEANKDMSDEEVVNILKEGADADKYKKDELKRIADALDVEYDSADTKKDIVKKIKGEF